MTPEEWTEREHRNDVRRLAELDQQLAEARAEVERYSRYQRRCFMALACFVVAYVVIRTWEVMQ